MPYPKDDAKLKKWTEGLQASVAAMPDEWNRHDLTIQTTLMTYANFLKGVAGYVAPDFQTIKAMLWTETGAWLSDWNTAPMQIGVNGDPGLGDLLNTTQGKLVLPPQYQRTLSYANVPYHPEPNIQAGVGYLHKVLARIAYVPDVPPPTSAAQTPAPVPTPTASSATGRHAHGQHKHPHHAPAKPAPKQHLAIVGWRSLNLHFAATRYNVGDGNYLGKLTYAYNLIQNFARPTASGSKP